jgi:hypothetical protein
MRHCVDDKEPGERFTVLLDGKDVSNKCFGFDTVEQWADCYQTDSKGKIIVMDTYEIARERLFGDIVVNRDPIDDEDSRKAHSSWIRRFFAGKRAK